MSKLLKNESTAPDGPALSVRGIVAVGIATIAIGFGGFGSWAALAPLSSAAIAPGEVTVDGYRKTVQHLEGGIVDDIPVVNGSMVQAGDVLVRLDDTRARATLGLLLGQYADALAREARLIAERDGLPEIRLPEKHRNLPHGLAAASGLEAALRGQRNIFEARRRALDGQIAVLAQKIEQFREEIAAMEAQTAAEQRQLDLIALEIKDVEYLFDKGLHRKTRLLELQRGQAQIRGQRGEHLALIARTRQAIAGTQLEIIGLSNDRLKEVTQQLSETQAQLHDLQERLLSADDELRRTVIRASQAGIVVGLRFHTRGGVIAPGEAILDLVSQQDRLVIEARVRPEDIDIVHRGLPAQVRLTAFNQRNTPTVAGTVALVSADRMRESKEGEGHYLARIELDPASLAALPDAALYPGMPAEAMIVTGTRTALDYFLAPMTRTVERAMREQ